jgi:hypothetical protein
MKFHPRRKALARVAALIGLQLSSGAAAEGYGDQRKTPRRGPPPEALEACTDAQEGVSCSFIGRRDKTVTGTCEFKRDDLVCVPEHRRRRGGPSEIPRT